MKEIISAIIIVSAIGLMSGILLSVFSVIMAVKKDEKADAIRDVLPGVNCGACGYSGCDGYAKALAAGEAKTGLCAPGGKETNEKICKILGVEDAEIEKRIAFVKCNGTCENAAKKMQYIGSATCKSANIMYNGTMLCDYGCLGFGDCAAKCPYNAISVKDGRAVVDKNACVGCGICVNECPKGIISLIPYKRSALVRCSNEEKGAIARKQCKTACIGCGKCVKACDYGAITLNNNLAIVDPLKCVGCGNCLDECPMSCITLY